MPLAATSPPTRRDGSSRSTGPFSIGPGTRAGNILGKRIPDLFNVAGRIFFETHFAPLLRMQGYFHEVALDLVKADGTRLAVLANASERRDAEGRLRFTRLVVMQATQRRRHERELSTALANEKEVATLREQFIAVLGHDLRNPIAAIIVGHPAARPGSPHATRAFACSP